MNRKIIVKSVVAIAALLMMSSRASAQTFLFEGKYNFSGVVSNPMYGSKKISDPFDCTIKVYTDRMIVDAKGSTEVWPLKRVLNDGVTREYSRENMVFTVNPNNHNVYFSPNQFYGAPLKNYNPTKTQPNRNQSTVTIPVTPTVPVTPSTTNEPPICYKCKGKGYYYINGNFTTCSQCGGGGRDWNSPR